MFSKDQIIEVARKDAAAKYGDLSIYSIEVEQRDDGWHVRFEPRPGLNAGGPVYVIDRQGAVVSKKYYQ